MSDRDELTLLIERMRGTREEARRSLDAMAERGIAVEGSTLLLLDLTRTVEIIAANMLLNGLIERLAPAND
jgi:rRNA processing protein Krr1/Pno1